eukprot:Gregarina_sp_Pseudo_9__5198@NODE_56_length_4725_cov_44_266965_g53_i0_p1_GENE_NODE_56_length_4725_cov_44_266965_g53_i0NODE_56_length_4725_cov_44_266965_g53_i0_p1_ORF_typecomplete_len451_score114_33_NODE_56_length_4725_cov_44_266965_g53_i07942146
MPDVLASPAAAMWDPAFLPSDTHTVGDLHEEIEKLASLFESSSRGTECFPSETACYSPVCGAFGGPVVSMPPRLASLADPLSKEASLLGNWKPADSLTTNKEPSILSNWKPQSLRETELLLIVDDLQNKLQQERACNTQLRQTIMEQRQALDICQASEKFYKLKVMKLEAQSSSSSSCRVRQSSVTQRGGVRPGRPRNVRPSADDGKLPFSRTAQRRRSRSVSTAQLAAGFLPSPITAGGKSSSYQGAGAAGESLSDGLMLHSVWAPGAVSDSELHCRNSSNETNSLMLMSSSSARRRSSSANRVREVMQSIGFLSARGPAKNAETETRTADPPPPSAAASPSQRLARPVSLLRPAPLTEVPSHQNVARAIAIERSRLQRGAADWTPPAASSRSLLSPKQQDPPNNKTLQGPLDIDQRLCSLRQLILQATARATSPSSSFPPSSFQAGNF